MEDQQQRYERARVLSHKGLLHPRDRLRARGRRLVVLLAALRLGYRGACSGHVRFAELLVQGVLGCSLNVPRLR
jgi:hypothetical protein